jgi:hypothetical protein
MLVESTFRRPSLSGTLAILLNMDVFVGLEDGDVVVGVLDTKSAFLVRDWTYLISVDGEEMGVQLT